MADRRESWSLSVKTQPLQTQTSQCNQITHKTQTNQKCSRTRLTINDLLKRLTSAAAAAAELNTVLRYMPRDAWLHQSNWRLLVCMVDHLINTQCANATPVLIDWLSSVLRLLQHSIGYMGDGFYRSKDPTNSIKVLKEKAEKNNTKNIKKTENTHTHTHTHTHKSIQITITHINTESPLVYNNMGWLLTRGQLPQRAGSLGLNGGGTAAAVPPPRQ